MGTAATRSDSKPSLADLSREVDTLVQFSLANNTWKCYKTAVESFEKFRCDYGLLQVWPTPLENIMAYIAYLSFSGRAPSTISTYISGLGHYHKMLCLPDPTANFLVGKMIEGARRKIGTKRDTRIPISRELLQNIISSLKSVCSSNYEALLFSAAFSLAFFALLRVGEITADSRSNMGVHTIFGSDVEFLGSELHLKIRNSKSDQLGRKVILVLVSQNSEICPVYLMKCYFKARGNQPDKPIFTHYDGSALTRFQFDSVLQKALNFCDVKDRIRPHSFRIGGATELAKRGVSDTEIKKWGRWASNAYSVYIRLGVI